VPTPLMPVRAPDGYYHPTSEADVVALVRHAAASGLQVRARGATHSIAWSIYTDAEGGSPPDRTLERSPPPGDNINFAFDKMMALEWIDEASGLVEVEPGSHMGYDPNDPFGVSTLQNSFLYQAFQKGWAVNIVGGITHQTVSGFTGTGSAGGSIQYAYDNVIAFRVVDGLGNAEWIEQGDPAFPAMLTAMGLLGIVTRLRFQLIPMYNITGTEVTTTPADPHCPIDMFGPGAPGRPSLQDFFTQQPYSRINWYPQKDCERVQIWQASRTPFSNDQLTPYLQFSPDYGGQTKMLLASLLFVIFGNTDHARIMKLLRKNTKQYLFNLVRIWEANPGGPLSLLGANLTATGVLALGWLLGWFPGIIKALFRYLLPLFTRPSTVNFSDWYWRSLCMDNTADDVILGTEFVEIWAPIQYTQQIMNLLQGMFDAKGAAATGYYAQEIYAAAPSPAWLNPSYSDGQDEYKDGVSRFDVYWYRDNEGAPDAAHGFFRQYWDLLRDNAIPFRFHWGKFVPYYDFPQWAAYYRANLPMFDAFMALRAQRDPQGLFLTAYWRNVLLGGPPDG
jgi:hypothetical protein